MKRKYVIVASLVGIGIAVLTMLRIFNTPAAQVVEDAKQITSYELQCNMEILDNDGIKSYAVTVRHSKGDIDYYAVELYDKSLNQAQVIVKNTEGVFVITPTLNQMFKFQSEWPLNTPKPYIYESLLEFTSTAIMERIEDGFLYTGEVTYKNDDRVKSQEVIFDKDMKPLHVSVMDENQTELIRVDVTDFKTNGDISKDKFNHEEILKQSTTSYQDHVVSSLPLYPVTSHNATLTSSEVSVVNNTTNHILKFVGDKDFTVVQSVIEPYSSMYIEEVNGDIVDLVDGFAFYTSNELTMVQSGIVCTVYSNELSQDEMVGVISSMQTMSVK